MKPRQNLWEARDSIGVHFTWDRMRLHAADSFCAGDFKIITGSKMPAATWVQPNFCTNETDNAHWISFRR